MLLALLAIWTNADYSWPKPLVLCRRQEMVLCRQPIGAHGALCVWCVVGIGARAHQERDREREVHTAAPKVRPHARACAHTRPRHRRGVGERPHVRWSVERTASLAVAKPRCSGGQTRWTCELSGLCNVYNPKRWPAEGAAYFDQSCGSIRPQLYSFGTCFYPSPCFGPIPARCTLFWPLPFFFPKGKPRKKGSRFELRAPH